MWWRFWPLAAGLLSRLWYFCVQDTVFWLPGNPVKCSPLGRFCDSDGHLSTASPGVECFWPWGWVFVQKGCVFHHCFECSLGVRGVVHLIAEQRGRRAAGQLGSHFPFCPLSLDSFKSAPPVPVMRSSRPGSAQRGTMRHILLSCPALESGEIVFEEDEFDRVSLSPAPSDRGGREEADDADLPMPVLDIYDFGDCSLGLPEEYRCQWWEKAFSDDVPLSPQVRPPARSVPEIDLYCYEFMSDSEPCDAASQSASPPVCAACAHHRRRLGDREVLCGLCYLRQLSEELAGGECRGRLFGESPRLLREIPSDCLFSLVLAQTRRFSRRVQCLPVELLTLLSISSPLLQAREGARGSRRTR